MAYIIEGYYYTTIRYDVTVTIMVSSGKITHTSDLVKDQNWQ